MLSKLEMAKAAGLNIIYCAETGKPIGSIDDSTFAELVELEDNMQFFESEDHFIDHLSMVMLPMNSRPNPLFRNMDTIRYALLVQTHKDDMYRFLLGRLIFERWSHMHGLVLSGSKTEWLKTIKLEAELVSDSLDILVRLDRILGLRKAFLPDAIRIRLDSIRLEWPGHAEVVQFIQDLERANILTLSNYDVHASGRIQGNTIAHKALMEQISGYKTTDFEAVYAARQAAEKLNEQRRESRATKAMTILSRKYAEQTSSGETQVYRGVTALIDYYDLSDTFDKKSALDKLSKLDSAKLRAKDIIRGAERIEARARTRKTEDATRKSVGRPRTVKAVFDMSSIFDNFDL